MGRLGGSSQDPGAKPERAHSDDARLEAQVR
jgi:hypothetical protein